MMLEHCGNNAADRKLGEYWERHFCRLAARYGFAFTPMQIARTQSAQAFARRNGGLWSRYTLPDITIWTFPGQHHEIKHKEPTRLATYGLEQYRLNALLWFASHTRQDVLYTIHNHALAGGRNGTANKLDHWFTVNISELEHSWVNISMGYSYVDGRKTEVPICYWDVALWTPLKLYWDNIAFKGLTHGI